jgi:hypothetical protein
MKKIEITLGEHGRRFSVNGTEITIDYTADSNAGSAVILDGKIIPAIKRGLELLNHVDDIDACLGAMLGALESCRDREAIGEETYEGFRTYATRIRSALKGRG